MRVLETERLILRPMEQGDLDDLFEVFSDPAVMASFAMQPFDRDQMQRWLSRNLEHQTHHGYGLFSVVRKSDGKVIGDCGLEIMEASSELGYDLRSDAWNKGYATEAACAVRDHAFRALGLDRLISLIRVGNSASERVAQKAGMSLQEEVLRFGVPYRVYAISRR